MFEQHFGFTQPPFRKDLPPPSLFRSQGYVELVTRLRQAVERCHIAVVTGDAGAGKSTALRSVAQTLGSGSYRSLYTANATMSARDLYRQWLRDLHMPPPYMLARPVGCYEKLWWPAVRPAKRPCWSLTRRICSVRPCSRSCVC